MAVELISSDLRNEWDAFVLREPAFALLQSWEWGEIKKRLGWDVFRLAIREGGAIVASAQMFIKFLPFRKVSVAYVPRGPLGRWIDPDIHKPLFQSLHQIAMQKNALLLKVEPSLLDNTAVANLLVQNGFHGDSYTNQPRSTIVLDLNPDLDTIFSQMRKTTRRKIKDASRKGLTVRIGSEADLPVFYELMKVTSERAGFAAHRYKYYQTEFQSLAAHGNSLMMLACYEDRPIAVHVSHLFGNHAAFFHQASSNDMVGLNPNSLLVWEAIKLLKERGCCTYDLWGIPDEIGSIVSGNGDLPNYERHDGLWGVYQFKAGFGKNVVVYPGAYDYVYRRLPYLAVSPMLARENTLEQVTKWASLNRFDASSSAAAYAIEELKFIKSYDDLNHLLREVSYELPRNSGLLGRFQRIPSSLQVEPTNCCNAECAFCPGHRSARKKGYMDWNLFKRIIDDASILGVRRIYLDLHGEPTLHPKIVEMIRHVKSRGLTVYMTTNGMLFDREMRASILKAGVTCADHIIFSILGDSKDTHNSIMMHSSLETIQANICALMEARKELGINGPVIETIFRKVNENKYEEEGYKDTWSGFVDHAILGGAVSQSFANYKMGAATIERTQQCKTIQERMTVYWDGDVTVCPHDLDGDYVLGNLNAHSIQEIWNGQQLSSLRRLHREKRFNEFPLCTRCDF